MSLLQKYGYKEVECWKKQKQDQELILPKQLNIKKKENKLCLDYSGLESTHNDMWFIDSGCSNHMCDIKSLFKELDHSQVRLGNDESIKVEGRGTISSNTSSSKQNYLEVFNIFLVWKIIC